MEKSSVRFRSKGHALAARGVWTRAARAAPARGPPSARGADGGPLPTRWSAPLGSVLVAEIHSPRI
eukprot:scaffold11764_cov91-Phaeocystis_antarctica.AAC.3